MDVFPQVNGSDDDKGISAEGSGLAGYLKRIERDEDLI
jgi:hypothetical protein